jgi:poly(3-hydroxybutyrate) depolymerase
MASRAAVEVSDLIAAVGIVEGTLYSLKTSNDLLPAPRVPVSEIAIQGDQDSLFCGAPGKSSQDDVFSYWAGATADNCRAFDTTLGFCTESSLVHEKLAPNCAAGTEVKTYILVGGFHTWYTVPTNDPARTPYNSSLTPGTGITTNDILWNFFSSHPKHRW